MPFCPFRVTVAWRPKVLLQSLAGAFPVVLATQVLWYMTLALLGSGSRDRQPTPAAIQRKLIHAAVMSFSQSRSEACVHTWVLEHKPMIFSFIQLTISYMEVNNVALASLFLNQVVPLKLQDWYTIGHKQRFFNMYREMSGLRKCQSIR